MKDDDDPTTDNDGQMELFGRNELNSNNPNNLPTEEENDDDAEK